MRPSARFAHICARKPNSGRAVRTCHADVIHRLICQVEGAQHLPFGKCDVFPRIANNELFVRIFSSLCAPSFLFSSFFRHRLVLNPAPSPPTAVLFPPGHLLLRPILYVCMLYLRAILRSEKIEWGLPGIEPRTKGLVGSPSCQLS